MEPNDLERILDELIDLYHKIHVTPSTVHHDSIRNLRAYLNLRQYDCADLQDDLTKTGLSSLGRSQSHIESTLHASIILLAKALGHDITLPTPPLGYNKAHRIMEKNRRIFSRSNDKTKIMITVPSNFHETSEWFKTLAGAGVDLFRINTAHDSPSVWNVMADEIDHLRKHGNKDLKIYVDLAGPKIRTADFGFESHELKIGSKKANRELYLCPKGTLRQPDSDIPVLYIDEPLYRILDSHTKFQILDTESRPHMAKILKKHDTSLKAVVNEKFYVDHQSLVVFDMGEGRIESTVEFQKPPKEIRVFCGDKVMIKTSSDADNHDHHDANVTAMIRCTLEEAASLVKAGDKVFLDDGKIEMVIDSLRGSDIFCSVLTRKSSGVVIKPEKGINFPQSDIAVRALSPRDIELLPDVCRYADIIGISFTQTREDIEEVISQLERHNKKGEIGVVAKIETQKGVENLPEILEALIEYGHSGVMIARGDLAIEIGYENLAYMQEEILDLCAAAHMPVILATQVLESKMKTNIPSRAEITDAAFAHKAECVMLNKGEFAVETIHILTTIFQQMDRVFRKNKLLLSPTFQWKRPLS